MHIIFLFLSFSDVIGRISSIGPIEQINTQTGLTDIRDILIENIRYTTHYYEKFPKHAFLNC